jgi:phospholipid/cholesterol/gamma-HCH transport system substrate-binding protein
LTSARALAFGALGVALVVVVVVLLTGGGGHKYELLFQNAGQLVKDDDVQVGGRRIGSVLDIQLTNNNQAKITIEVENDFSPLHEGTQATIRQTSLSGIANRYVNLSPGPNNARALSDGATIAADKTTSPVDLDQLFNTLDAPTRKALQEVVQGSATQYKGVEARNNRAAQLFNPALSSTVRLEQELLRDQATLRLLLRNGAKVSGALAQRAPTLTNLVSNANETAAAIARERAAFEQDLALLPPTLRRFNSTFVNLRATLTDLTQLVDASKPVAPQLAPFFRALRPLVRDARPTIHDLRVLINRPGANNDLINLLHQTPKLEQVAKPAFANSIDSFHKSTPVLNFIRPYTPDLVGWLRDFGQSASNYDANGHYARIQPIFNAFSFTDTPAGGVLTPRPAGFNFFEGLTTGNRKRCPGAATQLTVDQSNIWRDSNGLLDCDPSQRLPGP